jgi:hypothetical protein
VGDVIGGLERANGGAASEAGVRRIGEFPALETLYRGLEAENFLVEGCLPSTMRVGLCPYPSVGVSGESEMFQDPLCEALDDVERWADTLTRLAGGPARAELARGSP